MCSRLLAAGAALLLQACAAGVPAPGDGAGEGGPLGGTETVRVDLVDPAIPPAVAGEGGWGYQRSARADLTGDGREEQVVLTARAELYRGRPAWDDGQPWQVYVEDADGVRTYLYARRLQLGTLTMRLTRGGPGESAGIVLFEHLPDRLSLYEAFYRGQGEVETVARFRRDLDPRGDLASPRFP